VYEHEDKRIGFLLISEGPENKGNELWMAAVDPEYRNQGHGKTMILNVLNQFKGKNLFLFARCSPKSEIMYQLLTKNGFKLFETGPEGTRGIIYQL
jgi:ribosomal protein S18 acetylase RimI-like enzyme